MLPEVVSLAETEDTVADSEDEEEVEEKTVFELSIINLFSFIIEEKALSKKSNIINKTYSKYMKTSSKRGGFLLFRVKIAKKLNF